MNHMNTQRIEFGWGDRSIDWLAEEVEGTSEEAINRLLAVIPESHAEGTSVFGHRVYRSTCFPRTGSQWDADVMLEDSDFVWEHISGCMFAVGRSFAEFEGIAYRVYGYDDGSPIRGIIVNDQSLRTFHLPQIRTTEDVISMSESMPLSDIPEFPFEECYSVSAHEEVDWIKEGF